MIHSPRQETVEIWSRLVARYIKEFGACKYVESKELMSALAKILDRNSLDYYKKAGIIIWCALYMVGSAHPGERGHLQGHRPARVRAPLQRQGASTRLAHLVRALNDGGVLRAAGPRQPGQRRLQDHLLRAGAGHNAHHLQQPQTAVSPVPPRPRQRHLGSTANAAAGLLFEVPSGSERRQLGLRTVQRLDRPGNPES
jgi:hypothetical protein